jgi:hypothetical protein
MLSLRRLPILAAACLAGMLLGACATPPRAEAPLPMHVDARHGHGRAYPDPGSVVAALPRGAYWVRLGAERYWFHDAVWYRQAPGGYAVVPAPLGIVVPVLPPYYTTLRVATVQYYYANDAYYRYDDAAGGFVVVPPPAEAAPAAPRVVLEPFAYPARGQSPEQLARDRDECRRWALEQTGYDPSRADAALAAARDDYFRAMSACYGGRGYTTR